MPDMATSQAIDYNAMPDDAFRAEVRAFRARTLTLSTRGFEAGMPLLHTLIHCARVLAEHVGKILPLRLLCIGDLERRACVGKTRFDSLARQHERPPLAFGRTGARSARLVRLSYGCGIRCVTCTLGKSKRRDGRESCGDRRQHQYSLHFHLSRVVYPSPFSWALCLGLAVACDRS